MVAGAFASTSSDHTTVAVDNQPTIESTHAIARIKHSAPLKRKIASKFSVKPRFVGAG